MAARPKAVRENFLDRMPPNNRDAERGVVGSMLLNAAVIDDVASIVTAEDFYHCDNRKLFMHLVAMHECGERIDVTLLVARLKRFGDWDDVGGAAYLAEIAQAVPVAAHATYYAAIVREKSIRRRVIHAAADMTAKAFDEGAETDDVISECEATLQAVSTGDYSGEPVSFDAALLAACDFVDAIASRKREAGVMTGIECFDSVVGGLFPGELTLLAARPSVGKTALALQIAGHVTRRGKRGYMASLEMPTTQLALRVLCGHSGVSMARVRRGDVGIEDSVALTGASSALHGSPLVLHDRPGLKVADIRRACRRLHAKERLSLIVVDYLQRVTPSDRRKDRHLQIAEISWGLKELAAELSVPVLCLCQLSRLAEERDKKSGLIREPRLSDLKESGDLEQDADMVMLLHRQPRASDAMLILAKNRQGEQGKFHLTWNAERTRFDVPRTATHSEFDAYSGE